MGSNSVQVGQCADAVCSKWDGWGAVKETVHFWRSYKHDWVSNEWVIYIYFLIWGIEFIVKSFADYALSLVKYCGEFLASHFD